MPFLRYIFTLSGRSIMLGLLQLCVSASARTVCIGIRTEKQDQSTSTLTPDTCSRTSAFGKKLLFYSNKETLTDLIKEWVIFSNQSTSTPSKGNRDQNPSSHKTYFIWEVWADEENTISVSTECQVSVSHTRLSHLVTVVRCYSG